MTEQLEIFYMCGSTSQRVDIILRFDRLIQNQFCTVNIFYALFF